MDEKPFSLNTTTLIGRVDKYGLKLGRDGRATGSLVLAEVGRDEQVHTSYVHIAIWGKDGAVQASALPPGTLVILHGQVKPRLVGDQWKLVIAAREVQPLTGDPVHEYVTDQAE